ncbi:MAG: secretin N-terminal domain-containing protein, partial [Planctomycetota bacterium]
MTTGNRVLMGALCAAAIVLPSGRLLAQEETAASAESAGTVAAPSGAGHYSAPSGGMTLESIPPEMLKNMPPDALKRLKEQQAKMKAAARSGGSPKPEEKPKKPDEDKGKPGEDKENKDGSETVKRPTEPPEPVDPDAIRKMKLGPDGKVRLNFTGHPWPDVLLWLARTSGLNLDWEELPKDYLSLVTQREYSLDEVRDMINRHLLARGFTMIRQEEVLWVVKIEKLNHSMVPRVAPEELDQRDAHEFVKVSFRLDWMVAHQAVEELKPLLSSYAKLIPLGATNRIEAMDSVINLRELRRFLKDEQSLESQQAVVREFELKYTRAEDIKGHVLALLGMPTGGSSRGPSGPMNPQVMQQMQKQMAEQMKKMQQQMAQAAKKPGGGGAPPRPQTQVSLVVNQRKNSILALAPPDKMVIIAQTIDALDFPPSESDSTAAFLASTHVYRLETVDPESVVKFLEELGNLDPRTRLEVDKENGLIIAHAGLLDHGTIQVLVSKLDGGGRRCHVIPLKTLRAETVAETITFMLGGGTEDKGKGRESESRRSMFSPFGGIFGGYPSGRSRDSRSVGDAFRIVPDVKNNALVLWANEFERTKVDELLEDLRELPPKNGDGLTVQVYRLAAIDAEPVVKTLGEVGNLEPSTTLTVDEQNRAIIVTASPGDHKKISELLETLDGSARSFFVRHLRRLEADSVAGTIEFMLGVGEKKEKYESRYDYYPYTDRMRPQPGAQTDQFRVDADLEYNRLLLWATDIEMQEVENLLVKLGEIPAEGGSPDTLRVLDTGGGEELEALIERIRQTWTAPNELIVIPPKKPEETKPEEQTGQPASPPEDTTTQT